MDKFSIGIPSNYRGKIQIPRSIAFTRCYSDEMSKREYAYLGEYSSNFLFKLMKSVDNPDVTDIQLNAFLAFKHCMETNIENFDSATQTLFVTNQKEIIGHMIQSIRNCVNVKEK